MSDIRWNILQPVDVGSLTQQGFATGMALVKQVQTNNALRAYAANPDDPNAYNALAAFDPQTAASMQQQHLLRRKALIEQQERERRTALGELYTRDSEGAREEAVAAGDFDLAEQFGKLDETQQKRTAEFWQRAGPVAWSLKQERDPAKRTALWQEAKPILASIAGNPALLDRIDPLNDTQLEAAIATSQKIGDLITQSRVDWQSVPGEGGSAFAVDYFGRPVGSQNPYAGGGTPAQPQTGGGFEAAVEHILENEGGYAPSDMNGAPVNFGINQGANPDIDVKGLTRDQAKQIYLDRYWKPSGAESLPANLQAPYFDVYIRNPEFAKRALQESGGDAARFMDLADAYFGKLGQSGAGQKYARAWANRDAKNRAIAIGGNAPVRVSSKAEVDNLPSGATFIAPDGSIRRKP